MNENKFDELKREIEILIFQGKGDDDVLEDKKAEYGALTDEQ